MAYTDRQAIVDEVGENNMIPFLDDDQSGEEDSGLLDSIIEQASFAIDGYIGAIYDTPLTTVPPLIKNAARIFTCEILYRRRLSPTEKNPYKEQADQMRAILNDIGKGDRNLDVNVERAFTQGGSAMRGTIYGAQGSNNPYNTM